MFQQEQSLFYVRKPLKLCPLSQRLSSSFWFDNRVFPCPKKCLPGRLFFEFFALLQKSSKMVRYSQIFDAFAILLCIEHKTTSSVCHLRARLIWTVYHFRSRRHNGKQ